MVWVEVGVLAWFGFELGLRFDTTFGYLLPRSLVERRNGR
jgi:hypothetical protein